jgi:hypothetical protein
MNWTIRISQLSAAAFIGLLLVTSLNSLAEEQESSGLIDYRVVDLKPVQLNLGDLGLTDCTGMFALSESRALAACRAAKKDTSDNYGLRLFILATDAAKPRVLFTSRGIGDAYSVALQQRVCDSGKYRNLVLVDSAAEFAYGTSVYQLDKDSLKYLGEMSYVQMSPDKNPISALNIATFRSTKAGFTVSFAKDVYRMKKDGTYQHVVARKASMAFDGKKLK